MDNGDNYVNILNLTQFSTEKPLGILGISLWIRWVFQKLRKQIMRRLDKLSLQFITEIFNSSELPPHYSFSIVTIESG